MPEDDLPLLTFVDAASFEAWLERYADSAPGAWLRFAKKEAEATVSNSDAIDCALAYGWVDGQLGGVDALPSKPASHRGDRRAPGRKLTANGSAT